MSNWISQGNPKRYPVLAALERGENVDHWSVTHHLDDLQAGDRAALWVSGDGGGVVALGHVTGSVIEDVTSSEWVDPAERGMPATFCPLRFDEVFWRTPILEPTCSTTPGSGRPASSGSPSGPTRS